ncbi:hypothetical protein OsI_06624 [Oryza sativa Indica Group]|uniref:Plantacyanin n=1 Tax=Oryza sativa subsp. indica TaxID=39946 RepID=A2X341_ORYSI|nr:hypothetical protein OsI_06624 [Oryza sativa Indica Group]
MARAGSVCIAVLLAVCCAEILVAGATEWHVGDDKGWTFGVTGWENGKAFKVGDVLVFKYSPMMHNVVQVDQAGYDGCKVGAGDKKYASGNDRITLAAGKVFFICGFSRHCANGMKIAVATK